MFLGGTESPRVLYGPFSSRPWWRRIEISVDAEEFLAATLPSAEGENRCVGWVHPNPQQHQKGEG
jgi:hypothetical protein